MSKNVKHTPGPWKASGTSVYAETGREIIFGAYNMWLGEIEERKANARLIAAAPELLEALESTAAALAEIQNQETCDCEDLLRFACAAIARARGENK